MDEASLKKLKAEQEINIAKAQDVLKTLGEYERIAKEKAQAEDILREAREAAKDAEKGVQHVTAEFTATEAKLSKLIEPKQTKAPAPAPAPEPKVDPPKETNPPAGNPPAGNPPAAKDQPGSKVIQLVGKKHRSKSKTPRKKKKTPFTGCKTFASRLSRFVDTLLKTPSFKGRSIAEDASIGWHTGGYILGLLEEVDPPLRLVEHYGTKDAVFWRRTALGDAVVEKCVADPNSRDAVVKGFGTLLNHYKPPKFDNRNDPMSKMYVAARKALERLPLPDIPELRIKDPVPDFEVFHRTLIAATTAAYNTRQSQPFACTDCSCSYRYRSQLETHAKKVHPNRVEQVLAPYGEKQPILPHTPAREIAARARA